MPDRAQSLSSLYERELQPIVAELEGRRRNVRQRALKSTAALALGVLLVLVLAFAFISFDMFFLVSIGAIILAGILWYVINGGSYEAYRREFKDNVITRLVKLVDASMNYAPDQGISQAEFRDSRIYSQSVDRYNCEDLFYGTVGATDIRFSEVHAEYEQTTTDSKGNTTTTYHTIFQGIFFIGDFHKDFDGCTLVLPSLGNSVFGGFGRMLEHIGATMTGQGANIVQLEDPEFMRLFLVRSTDQIEARYILSTNLMQRLIDFRTRLNTPIAISFVNSNIYIAIPTTKDHFEPPSLWAVSNKLSLSSFETYLEDIRLATEIVEHLNLNRRIWSKQ